MTDWQARAIAAEARLQAAEADNDRLRAVEKAPLKFRNHLLPPESFRVALEGLSELDAALREKGVGE